MKTVVNKQAKKLVKLGVFDGMAYYKFKDLEQTPQIRLEAYLSRNHEFEELGIRKTDLRAFTETVAQLGNEGRFMEVQQLTGYLQALLDKPVTLYPTIYLASPMVIVGDEPLDEISLEFDQVKMKAALNDQNLESFFLSQIMSLKPSLEISSSSGQPLVYSSPKAKVIEMIFHEQISGKKITI